MGRDLKSIRLSAVLVVACFAIGCGDSPVGPTGPGAGPLIACPATQSVPATGLMTTLNYPSPMVSGGVAPVSISCVPPGGSSFPIGTSKVTCFATDAQQRTSSCSFSVMVQAAPMLSSTRFMAFGDSITYGVLAPCPSVTSALFDPQREFALLMASVNIPASYPTKLTSLLASRYVTQSPVVLNEGLPGEAIQQGVTRLPGVLTQDTPEVLLLQEGVNNINSRNPAVIPVVVDGLRTMIRDARGRGIRVMLGTLLPERPGSCRAGGASLIAPANDQIRALAATEGADLVDLYQDFINMTDTLLGEDGLHPTEAGYQQMAQTFFGVIQQRVEAAPFMSPSRR